jgi:uncharacterized radical SAM superfamily Fe-S cluster-containing enzyme
MSMRRKLQAGFSMRGVQKSFEELIYSVLGRESWRPTHISRQAILEYVTGRKENIQRAHGALASRLDRHERTAILLDPTTDVVEFEVWWKFFLKHDKTVLITRSEHAAGKTLHKKILIELPDPSEQMFDNSGFSVRLRKKTEGVWLHKKCEELGLVKNALE